MSEPKDIWYADDGSPMCRHGGRSHSLNLACPTDDCERCGRPNDEHPNVCPNQSGEMFMVPADIPRAPKWQRVEPGTVIPAGQPYRVEPSESAVISEYRRGHPADWTASDYPEVFIDSSWKPPLVLPTTATWGIAIVHEHKIAYAGKWTHRRDGDQNWFVDVLPGGIQTGAAGVKAFIPLTPEQITQVEDAQR